MNTLEITIKKYLNSCILLCIFDSTHTTYLERKNPTGNVIKKDIKYAAVCGLNIAKPSFKICPCRIRL
jgi:hypothetical protein